MSGIYIHIPFCKKKCTYCDFHFSTTFEAYRDNMIAALVREIEIRLSRENDLEVKTIYFGGGTPSLLNKKDWEKLVSALSKFCDSKHLTEFTIEANPDDISAHNLKLWKNMGVNRLSIGVQSFRQQDLIWMNRAHSADESLKCIQLAQEYGFHNLTIDLMYGLPNQSLQDWEEQLHIAGKLGVPHISAYCLTVEERTALKKRVDSGALIVPEDDLVEAQFQALINILYGYGLEQYEISNFAIAGHEAVHNSNYWLGENYVAIGPSAHGFDGVKRYWNVSNNQKYIRALEENKLPETIEILSPKDRFNELILTGLRTKWGVKLDDLNRLVSMDKTYVDLLKSLTESGVIEQNNGTIRLSQIAKIKADYYAAMLFLD